MIARFALCLLLALAALPLGAQPEDSARRITSQPSYRGYRVESAPRGSGTSSADSDSSASSADGRRAGARGRERSRSRRDTTSGADLSVLGGLLQVLMWIAVIAATGAAIYFVVKALMGIKRRPRPPEVPSESAEIAPQPQAPEDAPVPVFADALALARQEYERAVAAQDWARAALVAYRIFWLEAGWQGCVAETDVRTWRDAVRMVRADGTRHGVRDLLRLIERVRYAGHQPDRAEFEAWRVALQGLNPREALA